ncbi:hypothetical protein [Rhodococcus jostii]|nr:hypothetical protein [Rhodococcus jostii]
MNRSRRTRTLRFPLLVANSRSGGLQVAIDVAIAERCGRST